MIKNLHLQTGGNSLFLWFNRKGRQVASSKTRCMNSPERENTNVRIALWKYLQGASGPGTRSLVSRSGVRRKFVSTSQIFTAPFPKLPAKLIPIIVPGDRLARQTSSVMPQISRGEWAANEEAAWGQMTNQSPGMESGLFWPRDGVLRKHQGIHQIVSHMFVRQQYPRISTRDQCLKLVIQSQYQGNLHSLRKVGV